MGIFTVRIWLMALCVFASGGGALACELALVAPGMQKLRAELDEIRPGLASLASTPEDLYLSLKLEEAKVRREKVFPEERMDRLLRARGLQYRIEQLDEPELRQLYLNAIRDLYVKAIRQWKEDQIALVSGALPGERLERDWKRVAVFMIDRLNGDAVFEDAMLPYESAVKMFAARKWENWDWSAARALHMKWMAESGGVYDARSFAKFWNREAEVFNGDDFANFNSVLSGGVIRVICCHTQLCETCPSNLLWLR